MAIYIRGGKFYFFILVGKLCLLICVIDFAGKKRRNNDCTFNPIHFRIYKLIE